MPLWCRTRDRFLPGFGPCLARATAVLVLLLFRAPAFGQAFSLLHEFSARGGFPLAGLTRGSDGKLYGTLSSGGYSGYGSVYSLTPDGSGGYAYAELYGAVAGDGAIDFSGDLLEAADGQLYGGTYFPDGGVIYRVDKSGNFAVVHTLQVAPEGGYPGPLIQPGGGDFYGVASLGGPADAGTAFRMDMSGNLTVLHAFGGPEGRSPYGVLLLASDGFLYGVAIAGGSGRGTIYRMDLSGNTTLLHAFLGPDGTSPQNGLIEGSDGFLYGTTYQGGTFDRGTIFRVDTSGAFTTLHSFSTAEGSGPVGSLLEASDGNFYGTTQAGGAADGGTLFRVDGSGAFATLHEFASSEGASPYAKLLEDGGQLVGTAYWRGTGGVGTAFAASLSGSVQFVHAFQAAPEGSTVVGGMLQASDGLLYGTAAGGGDSGSGTLFKLDPDGGLTRLHSFDGTNDGAGPQVALIQASDGDLYGTAGAGGGSNHGTVFRCSTSGLFAALHSFSGADGDFPYAALVEGTDGSLYGTTYYGGSLNLGTAFRVDGTGMFAMIHDFTGPDGRGPSGLILGSEGDLHGATSGGSIVPAFVFRMDAAGAVTPVYSFGEAGNAGNTLLLASDGSFYAANLRSVYRLDAAGNFSVLHEFRYPEPISYPGELVEGSDGNFYSTGLGNGETTRGAVFRIDPAGNLTVIHQFLGPEGGDPRGRLLEASDGLLYGTATYGGQFQGGVVYRVDPAAVISVGSVSPASGPAAGGTSLTILGANFQPGATVTVGYLPATDVVVSGATQITATAPALPAGAAWDVFVQNPDQSFAARSRAWTTDALDVPASDLFHDDVNRLFSAGITVGCGDGLYCVTAPVSRAQVAVLILKSMLGSGYVPPPASGTVFADVAAGGFAAAWIEDLAARGISAGCGGGNYCPDEPVTRAEMAPLLLKAAIGAGYVPPAATGDVFGDVPVDGFAAAWIEDLSAREIAAGCHVLPALYCPTTATTRGQMAALLVAAFGLQ